MPSRHTGYNRLISRGEDTEGFAPKLARRRRFASPRFTERRLELKYRVFRYKSGEAIATRIATTQGEAGGTPDSPAALAEI